MYPMWDRHLKKVYPVGYFYVHARFLAQNTLLKVRMTSQASCDTSHIFVHQESFLCHFKDEAYIKRCEMLGELKEKIKDYMIYYNYYRYQWN